jgi:hypothetical protein
VQSSRARSVCRRSFSRAQSRCSPRPGCATPGRPRPRRRCAPREVASGSEAVPDEFSCEDHCPLRFVSRLPDAERDNASVVELADFVSNRRRARRHKVGRLGGWSLVSQLVGGWVADGTPFACGNRATRRATEAISHTSPRDFPLGDLGTRALPRNVSTINVTRNRRTFRRTVEEQPNIRLHRRSIRCTVIGGRSLSKPTQPVRRLRRPIGLRPVDPSL